MVIGNTKNQKSEDNAQKVTLRYLLSESIIFFSHFLINDFNHFLAFLILFPHLQKHLSLLQ